MITSTLIAFMAISGPASAKSGTASTVTVAASTAAAHSSIGVSTQTVMSLYTGDRVRDPFQPPTLGATSSRRIEDVQSAGPEVVDIHAITLRGLMKDRKNDYALFSSEDGGMYFLRGGRLYNERNKLVPGITGGIRIKQKTVELITRDKDVQIFRLGEDENEKEKP